MSRILAQAIANFFLHNVLVNDRRISNSYCCYKRLSKMLCLRFWAIAKAMDRQTS